MPRLLPPFNNRQRLLAVELPDGRLGVADEHSKRVWVEHEWTSTVQPHWSVVELPTIPEHYGKWVQTSIGGVSNTVRRTGILRGAPHAKEGVLFATHASAEDTVAKALADADCAVGQTLHDDEMGFVTEVVVGVCEEDLAHVAARMARSGATPVLEDPSLNALRSLGIERLDRIHSQVVCDEEIMHAEDDGNYGLRRGIENWHFPWLPSWWRKVPITWDHMVENVSDVEDVSLLPYPLRQHVAHARADCNPLGTLWTRSAHTPTDAERAHDGVTPPFFFWRVWHTPPESLVEALRDGEDFGDDDALLEWKDAQGVPPDLTPTTLVEVDGTWYHPTTRRVRGAESVPKERVLSAGLSTEQSRQLIEAFYLVSVERVSDPKAVRALHLILYRYMVERGYTARWIGKYKQDARHIGNGTRFRAFRNHPQYRPWNLPARTIHKLCDSHGNPVNRGSKGSRSKYKSEDVKERYVPKRRLQRTSHDEDAMREQ